MEPSVIEQIVESATLRHLIAGWVKVTPHEKDAEAIAKANRKLLSLLTRERWAAFSGVSAMDVDAWADFLFAHRIITASGVDHIALTIVSRIGIAALPKDLREQLTPKTA